MTIFKTLVGDEDIVFTRLPVTVTDPADRLELVSVLTQCLVLDRLITGNTAAFVHCTPFNDTLTNRMSLLVKSGSGSPVQPRMMTTSEEAKWDEGLPVEMRFTPGSDWTRSSSASITLLAKGYVLGCGFFVTDES